MLSVLATSAVLHFPHHRQHTKGCRTDSCDVRVGRRWWRRHHSFPLNLSYMARCVANRESGEPGSTSLGTIRWHLDQDGVHTGAFQFDGPTWHAAGGTTPQASEAPPRAQVAAFNRWYPVHPGAWAETAPYC